MKKLLIMLITGSALFFLSFSQYKHSSQENTYTKNSYVHDVLYDMGVPKPAWFPENFTDEDIRRGKEIVEKGFTDDPNGGRSKYVSLYYVCTNCHNSVIEDPVLTSMDPEARLTYAIEKQLPFLQGTTFYGATNRESWYNDDYYKKYGDLVKPAKDNIREAIQLCAMECSKGRPLLQWEEDVILAYYLSISYKLSDVLSDQEIEQLNADKSHPEKYAEWIARIRGKYAIKSPATFVEPPYDKGANLPSGDPARGKAIYNLSCQYCHKAYGCSDNVFDDSGFTFRKFNRDFDKDYWWLFKAVRHGFYSYPGHEPYMPHYTAERMTDQQVMDLKSYFQQQAQQ